MLKLGNIDIGSVFLGGTEITEAYLGSQLVYENGWPAVPADGRIWYNGAWGTGIGHTNAQKENTLMIVDVGETGTITGVVFTPNTNTLTIQSTSSTYAPTSVTIDGTTLSRSTFREYIVPARFLDGAPHTIAIKNSNYEIRITSMTFNI